MMKMTFNIQENSLREVVAICDYFVGEHVESLDQGLLIESKNVLFLGVLNELTNFLDEGTTFNGVIKITCKEDGSKFLCRIKIFPDGKDSASIELINETENYETERV